MYRRSAVRALLLAVVAASAACADQNPAAVRETPGGGIPVQAALQCHVDVRAETLACELPAPAAAPGVSPLITHGGALNVQLVFGNTRYDRDAGIFSLGVAVENLLAQALGTRDGSTPSPEGIRVFFLAGPYPSEGAGTITVENADGEGMFTAAAQPYFRYEGNLAPGDTTAFREWRFGVPTTIPRFTFTAYVSADVPGAQSPTAAVLFLGGYNQPDTVDAVQAAELVIGVRRAGGVPAANTPVQVQGARVNSNPFVAEMQVAAPGAPAFGDFASVVTAEDGTVRVRVRRGPQAGIGRLVVTAPGLSISDTVQFVILPGAAAKVESLPADTAVMMGRRAPLRVTVSDRYGNVRPNGAAVVSVASGPGTASGHAVLAGTTLGRVTAIATVNGISDTSSVAVVPEAIVAATSAANHTGQAAAIYTLALDGSEVQQVMASVVGAGYFGTMDVAWLGRDTLVYHDNNWDHTKQLYTLDLATSTSARLLPEGDRMDMENVPLASRDGSWVYFSGGTFWSYHMYRVRRDGTDLQRISSETPSAQMEWGADPSPDGTRVVYITEGSTANNEIAVMTIATRQVRRLNMAGSSPRWSPDGTRIAVLARLSADEAERLTLVNPDGTGVRRLGTTLYYGDISWSPDGKYIVGTTHGNRLSIVEVATGTEVIVQVEGIAGALMSPDWKP